jgi:hypothetical protein
VFALPGAIAVLVTDSTLVREALAIVCAKTSGVFDAVRIDLATTTRKIAMPVVGCGADR